MKIAGRGYVDGGVASTSNLDVLAGLGLDLVICLNPTSSLHAPRPRTLGERAASLLRQASGRLLGNEARLVRESGTDVFLIQPTVTELDAMGTNLMSSKRRHQVIAVAAETVGGHLREPEVRAACAHYRRASRCWYGVRRGRPHNLWTSAGLRRAAGARRPR